MRFLTNIRHPDVAQVGEAWREYVGGGRLAAGVVRPYVLKAWERSRASGCDARMARAQQLSEPETAALMEQRRELLEVAGPFLTALSRAAGADRHAAMLGDADGRLLRVVGDELTLADEGFPRAGSLLAESHAGANGVGTALAERGYVELVGPEHYIQGFHCFTCQGVPLEGPGGLAGVLSMSVRRLETADRVRDILFCASEAAECEMLGRWLAAAAGAGEPVMERLRQDMVQRLALARLRLEVAARQIAAGADASTTIGTALELSRKFARQAGVWRSLALGDGGGGEQEVVDLGELVEDFFELLRTEARVAGVALEWGRVEKVKISCVRGLLARRVLGCFLSALQGAEPLAVLEASVLAGPGAQLRISRRTPAGLVAVAWLRAEQGC